VPSKNGSGLKAKKNTMVHSLLYCFTLRITNGIQYIAGSPDLDPKKKQRNCAPKSGRRFMFSLSKRTQPGAAAVKPPVTHFSKRCSDASLFQGR
jgi:hypothetical protein